MGVDLLHLWAQMGMFAKGIVVIMALMSVFSLTIMITKLIQIKKSEAATRKFAPDVLPRHPGREPRPGHRPVREEPRRPPVPRRGWAPWAR